MYSWTIEQTRQLYNLDGWSNQYFDINDKGHVVVTPDSNHKNNNIDLLELVNEIKNAGITTPVLVRFTDILHDRINTLHSAFENAKNNFAYTAPYTPVYPIKVNQEFSVVNEIANTSKHNIGLEAGSKTELMAVLALADQNNGIIVCNGYKDREYIRLALIGKQLGHRVFLVIEKLSEIDLIFQESKKLNIEPLLGIRVRLTAAGSGKWQNTGGEKAKFGLSSAQTINALEQLSKQNALHTLSLLHFHLGSQITDIENIKTGMLECAAYFKELHKLGAPITYVDVGGGLSVDYEGTHSQNYFSMNYSIDEYASTIVGSLKNICDKTNIPHPTIISESGRALTAHHAVLIVNVIDTDTGASTSQPDANRINKNRIIDNNNADLQYLKDILQQLSEPISESNKSNHNFTLLYKQSSQYVEKLQKQYLTGELSIGSKADAESLLQSINTSIQRHLNSSHVHDSPNQQLQEHLKQKLARKYFCNFSVFQSIPDAWAIEQIFPIMPLHQLDQQPTVNATLHDISCDSDGRIDNYAINTRVEPCIRLHQYNNNEAYYLGIFLVGAYQEILGDMHNLFGDTNSIDVQLDGQSHCLKHKQHGDSVEYVLQHIHFDTEKLLNTYQTKLANSKLPEKIIKNYLTELQIGLKGFTYLED